MQKSWQHSFLLLRKKNKIEDLKELSWKKSTVTWVYFTFLSLSLILQESHGEWRMRQRKILPEKESKGRKRVFGCLDNLVYRVCTYTVHSCLPMSSSCFPVFIHFRVQWRGTQHKKEKKLGGNLSHLNCLWLKEHQETDGKWALFTLYPFSSSDCPVSSSSCLQSGSASL